MNQVELYCISGLAANKNLFSRLQLSANVSIHPIAFQMPETKESLRDYAIRLGQQISHDRVSLLGVSFGGMLVTELAKYLKTHTTIIVDEVIIISSVLNAASFPWFMNLGCRFRLYKILPYKMINRVGERFVGFDKNCTKEELEIKINMLKSTDWQMLKRQLYMIMQWQATHSDLSVHHIHGDADKLFPLKRVKPQYIINGGNHFMVYQKAVEISQIVRKILIKDEF